MFRLVMISLFAATLGGCMRATDTFSDLTPLRAGEGLPALFEPPTGHARVAPADTIAGSGCLSPLSDPRDGTELLMVRSSRHRADYSVPAGRYGVQQQELLRVECNTGRPLGIVSR